MSSDVQILRAKIKRCGFSSSKSTDLRKRTVVEALPLIVTAAVVTAAIPCPQMEQAHDSRNQIHNAAHRAAATAAAAAANIVMTSHLCRESRRSRTSCRAA